jgi:hypothetical protein
MVTPAGSRPMIVTRENATMARAMVTSTKLKPLDLREIRRDETGTIAGSGSDMEM